MQFPQAPAHSSIWNVYATAELFWREFTFGDRGGLKPEREEDIEMKR